MKIFIVEDNLMYANLLKLHLKKYTPDVTAFTSGEDCIAQLGQNPDLIVLDYFLRLNTTGLDVLKQVVGFNPDIPVIILSSQESVEIAMNTLKYGALHYIEKNEKSLDKLDRVLEKILRKKTTS